jgi:hypothetical protein
MCNIGLYWSNVIQNYFIEISQKEAKMRKIKGKRRSQDVEQGLGYW